MIRHPRSVLLNSVKVGHSVLPSDGSPSTLVAERVNRRPSTPQPYSTSSHSDGGSTWYFPGSGSLQLGLDSQVTRHQRGGSKTRPLLQERLRGNVEVESRTYPVWTEVCRERRDDDGTLYNFLYKLMDSLGTSNI